MRLIDADNPYIPKYFSEHDKERFLSGLILQPTIEAEPVKHGRWIFDVCNHREHMKCSECLHSYEPTGVFTYCPNCGAKMDGKENDNAQTD